MYEDLKGKTAIVTGAGKKTGIGFGIAEKLASCGVNLVIADLGKQIFNDELLKTGTKKDMDSLADELASSYGISSMAVNVDITDNASIAAMVNDISKRYSHIDILCNNAGATFGVPNTIVSYNEEEWIRTVNVNLFGTFRVSRAILPLMLGSPGSIINTASRAGKVPPVFNSAYAVAKAGVIMLTKTMAKELGGAGIRVNAICPGQIRTDLEKWRFELEANVLGTTVEQREEEMCKTIPLGKIGTIGNAGDLVVFLASDASAYITGQAINLDGGQCMEL